MNLSPVQKNKLISIYPELKAWFEARETMSSSTADALLSALLGKVQQLKGDKGDTPIKGVDYWTAQEVDQVVNYILSRATPKKGVHYEDGKNGENYILTSKDKRDIASLIDVPVVEKITERVEVVKEVSPKSIDVSSVKGAVSKKELEVESKKILSGMALVDGRIKLIDQRWRGGGLSKVSHDSTLSGDGTASNPLVVIGGGFSGAQEKTTTAPDSSRQTFTFTHTPKLIFWGGGLQTLTDDYTVSGNTITFTGTLTPQTGDTVLNVY